MDVAQGPDATSKAALDAGRNAFETAQQMGQQMSQEFTKLFSQMRLPAMPDMEALMAAQRKNIEVLTQANRVAMEGAQAVARRHMEIMQHAMSDMTEAVRAMSTADDPKTRVAKQAELVKSSYENAVTNLRELSDMIQRANGEAIGLLNRRFSEAMDEIKTIVEKHKAV
jgi:phasin family protein